MSSDRSVTTTGAILTPIYQSTTCVQPAVGVHQGFTYSRAANSTVHALERVPGAPEKTPLARTKIILVETHSTGNLDRDLLAPTEFANGSRATRRVS